MSSVIDELLAQLHETRAKIKNLEEWAKTAQVEVLSAVPDDVEKLPWNVESSQGTATVVRPTTIKFNEEALAAELGPELWSQVTKVSVDQKKLSDLVSRGIVSIETVVKNSEEVARTPYLRTKEV
jgi:hypothetical protein